MLGIGKMDHESRHLQSVTDLVKQLFHDSQVEPSDLEIELVSELSQLIASSKIKLTRRASEAFDTICSKYPIAVNRIAWVAFRTYSITAIRPDSRRNTSISVEEMQRLASNKIVAIRTVLESIGVGMLDSVLVAGDDMEMTLEMDVSTLLEVLPILAVQSQHTYALGMNGDWVLHCLIEGEIAIGRTSDAIEKGYIDSSKYVSPQTSGQ
jgi:hypothetical protein